MAPQAAVRRRNLLDTALSTALDSRMVRRFGRRTGRSFALRVEAPPREIEARAICLDLAPELAPELELALELAPELDLAPELAPQLELALELGLAPEAFRLRSSPPVGQGVPPPPSPPLPPPPPPSLLPLLADLGPIRTRNS